MGKMIDIDSFHKRYIFHATNKAEAEFNQIISEIKKTESTSKDDSTIQSKNDSAEMTIEDTKMHLYMQESYALGKDYRALENALDIIHKYEKIREIAFPLQFCSTDKLNHKAIMKICEVLEDETDN